jgi:hypothetical protein
VKRFALLLLFATTALGGEKGDVALLQFLPAIPKRMNDGECWPARARVQLRVKGKLTGHLEAIQGETTIYDGAASATKTDAGEEYELLWPIERACKASDPRAIRYRLTLRVNGAPASVVRSSAGDFPQLLALPPSESFPPLPPPGLNDAFDHGCDLYMLGEPVLPVALDRDSAEITAYRVAYGKGKRSFHGMRIVKERKVPAATARRIIEILSDRRNYACSGMACINIGMAFHVQTTTGNRDLGICLECRYLHDMETNDQTPLSERGVKELTKIYETLFK